MQGNSVQFKATEADMRYFARTKFYKFSWQ